MREDETFTFSSADTRHDEFFRLGAIAVRPYIPIMKEGSSKVGDGKYQICYITAE
jgi:hypothetical protein